MTPRRPKLSRGDGQFRADDRPSISSQPGSSRVHPADAADRGRSPKDAHPPGPATTRHPQAPRLVAAIVDRLTFNAHIIETGTNSYRLLTTKTGRRGGARTRDHNGARSS
jgi:hypothetical protein